MLEREWISLANDRLKLTESGLEALGSHRSGVVLRGSSVSACGVHSAMKLSLLYRGPLASCNYDLPLLPVRQTATRRLQLEVGTRPPCPFRRVGRRRLATHSLRILFTPWGEARYPPLVSAGASPTDPLAAYSASRDSNELVLPSIGWGRDLSRIGLVYLASDARFTLRRVRRRKAAAARRRRAQLVGVVGLREAFDAITIPRSG